MGNYPSGRTQAVYIDASLSTFFSVDVGVPQGSIYGPSVYKLSAGNYPGFKVSSADHWLTECGGKYTSATIG